MRLSTNKSRHSLDSEPGWKDSEKITELGKIEQSAHCATYTMTAKNSTMPRNKEGNESSWKHRKKSTKNILEKL